MCVCNRRFKIGWSADSYHVGPYLIHRSVHVLGFVVNEGKVRQGFLQVLRSSLANVIKPVHRTKFLLCRRCCIILETDSSSKNS